MKSAYELAMERLEKESPLATLTDEQKKALAEVEELYKSKVAEKEVFLGDLIVKAREQGDFSQLEELEEQRRREIARLHAKVEEEKAKIRDAD